MSRSHSTISTIGAVLLLLRPPIGAAQEWRPKVDALARPAVESGAVMGLAIGIVQGGRSECFGYGKISTASDKVPDETTLFEIGSITKVFTALALADMAREGLVALDDPVRKWLPDSVKVPTRDGQEITLAHLASHTSGLPRLGRILEFQAVGNPLNPFARFSVEDLYKTLATSSLAATPGTKYAYSNLGAGLLGHALARRAGMDYEELLRRRILVPLEMNDTRIALSHDAKSRLAVGHDIDGNPLPPWDLPTLAGAGALRSDVKDLVRFVQANLRRGKPPLAEAMETTYRPRLDFAPDQSICLGWHWRKSDKILWHNGQTGGYHAFVGLNPGQSLGVVVLGNTAGGTVDQIAHRLLDLLAGKPIEPLEFKKPHPVDPAVLDQYVGNYELYPNCILYVTREGDRLWVQATNQPRLGVYAQSDTKFSYRAVDAQITFVRNKEGRVDKLVLHQHGLDLPAWKGGLIANFGGQLFKRLAGPAQPKASDTPAARPSGNSGQPQPADASRNARRPVSEADLRYWLENMIVYHRFRAEEAAVATGMKNEEVEAAAKRWDLQPGAQPQRRPGDPLVVLPYPGGRHPRLGFLEGAIDPQRETKVSIFTPWDPASYVVFDVPEAVWSNLGLTYLAHTHIPTVWTKQGIHLPVQEWERREGGVLRSTRRLPNGIVIAVEVRPKADEVQFDLSLANGTDKPLTGLRIQNCVMLSYAKGFSQQASDNKVSRVPFEACRSDDGTRWIVTAWNPCWRTWDNPQCPCMHSDPVLPDCAPGQTTKASGFLWFYAGTDIQSELQRLSKKTGWPLK